jgi:threonine/homoserine/homoserine lactone efflux protein
MHLLFILGMGFLLSFLGQLPLGTMSMTSTQIAVQENYGNALKFAIGVTLIEMCYLRLVLAGVDWILGHKLLFTVFNWLTVVLFLALGVFSFIAANRQHHEKKALLLNNNFNRFLLGVSMSALNPAQVPFWFIWTSYFMDAGWLSRGFESFNYFTAGAGAGTMVGLVVYIYGGNWLVKKMNTSNKTLNKIMGVIFIIAAVAQLYRVLKPD